MSDLEELMAWANGYTAGSRAAPVVSIRVESQILGIVAVAVQHGPRRLTEELQMPELAELRISVERLRERIETMEAIEAAYPLGGRELAVLPRVTEARGRLVAGAWVEREPHGWERSGPTGEPAAIVGARYPTGSFPWRAAGLVGHELTAEAARDAADAVLRGDGWELTA